MEKGIDMHDQTDAKQVELTAFEAGVFDLDGVVTRTATLHAGAWKDLFDDYLRQRAARTGEAFRPFDIGADYLRYVDGKPRYDGVRSFLESRGITLEEGSPQDPPERDTVCGLGNRKNRLLDARLTQQGVEVFESTLTLIHRLRAAGLGTALVSSSANAARVLEVAGLSALFDVRIDGVEAARLGLRGKPAPDLFACAAEALGVEPGQAFAVEDALSGVAAARAAGFGLVIGIDRASQRDALLEHGADVVVEDLAELDSPSAAGVDAEAELPDALAHFAAIARRLRGKTPAVFLDYDGTLTPIVERPELAVLDDTLRATIRELARTRTVAIVSGRDRADVARLVGLDRLIYAGSHGFDITGPEGLHMEHPQAAEFLPALERAEAQLHQRLDAIDGVLVERKRFAIAVHYRRVAAAQVADVEAAVAAVAGTMASALRRTGGKKIFELRPQLAWDKGRAVGWLLEALELRRPDVLPFYIGDDETDEDAFAALRELGGIGLLVADGPQTSAAEYRLADSDAVGDFLSRLMSGEADP